MAGNINLLNDIGAPALVTAVNLWARSSNTALFGNMATADVATYAMTAGGYLAAYMGWGGKYSEFLKNVAIASAPLSFDKLYTKIKGGTQARPVAMRVSRYPGPAAESPFTGVRLV